MKSKTRDHRFLLLVAVSFLITALSAFVPGIASFPVTELRNDVTNNSERETTIVWGKPLYFVVDRLDNQSIGAIDRADNFSGGALLFDWLLWFVLVWMLSYLVPDFVAFMARFVTKVMRPAER